MFNWLLPKPKKPKTLGQRGEEFAQTEYKKRGYKIIAANFFNKKGLRKGEVDFVAADKKKIIFVEVKTRSSDNDKFGTGREAVNQFKQIKLLKSVKLFLLQYPKYRPLQPQIDVCLVDYKEFDPVRSRNNTGSTAASNGVDKNPFSAIIIPNAVEDSN